MPPITTIYLDTNIWIELARVHYDKNSSIKKRQILAFLKDRVIKREFRFPLSMIHCAEMVKMKDHRNRRRLWEFAVNFSQCNGIINRPLILPYLIEESVHKLFNVPLNRQKLGPFTHSGLFGLQFQDSFPLTANLLHTEMGWKHFWLDMPDEIRAQLFLGLKDIEVAFTKNRNYLKDSFRNEGYEFRKRAYIATLLLDSYDIYLKAIYNIGRNKEDIEALSMEDKIRLITEVPPFDLEASLAVQHQQQWDRPEKESDIRDISHLCMAVPYCDVVLTERYWVDKLKREQLDRKYKTILLSDINKLLDI